MSDFGEAAKKVQKLKYNIEAETERGLEEGMEDVKRSMQHHLAHNESVASGKLFNGLTVISDPAPPAYATEGIYGPDYWRYLEFGTGVYSSRGYKAPDYAAPVAPIYQWVVAKGITPDPDEPYHTQWGIAQAIANSISYGTEPHQFVRPAWRSPLRGKRHVVDKVEDGMSNALRLY